MLIPSEIENTIYSSTLGKIIEVNAKGTVNIGRNLKPTSGNHFSQEIHVENLETSQEVRKAIEFDEEFEKDVLIKLINNALDSLEPKLMEIK